MFKSSFSSYIPWFKKTSSSGAAHGPAGGAGGADYKDEPLVVPSADHQLINISMRDEDDAQSFVEIQCRKLTYAEAASMSKPGRVAALQVPKPGAHAQPRKARSAENQYTVLATDDAGEYEPYKSDVSYRKSKQFKNKQFETIQKKKQRNAERKAQA